MTSWKDLEKELLRDKETKKEFDKLSPRYVIISELISLRVKNKMTQEDVAKKLGTKQSAIARLEAGNTNPSIGFLEKVANAMGTKLTISLQ
ncbi:MAG: helix-turn-helix transcriptional regulator [Candidatus Levyibacteriota bacterium]